MLSHLARFPLPVVVARLLRGFRISIMSTKSLKLTNTINRKVDESLPSSSISSNALDPIGELLELCIRGDRASLLEPVSTIKDRNDDSILRINLAASEEIASLELRGLRGLALRLRHVQAP